MSQDMLVVDGLTKRFGGLQAVDGCSFSVRLGSITGMIGPNGAGKSTVFNLLSGLARPDAGSIRFEGREVAGKPAHQIARLGLIKTFQIPRELAGLTVMENLKLAPFGQLGENIAPLFLQRAAWRQQEAEIEARAWKVLETVELRNHATQSAAALSVGQKKLLELARALMAQPRLLLLDEPAAGVNPRLMQQLLRVIRRLHSDGMTFLIIEHNMDLVMSLCEKVLVLERGRLLTAGTPSEVQKDEAVLAAYLGGRS